jgi:hypothetical protein
MMSSSCARLIWAATRAARLSCATMAALVGTGLATPPDVGAAPSIRGISAGPGRRVSPLPSPELSASLDRTAGQEDVSAATTTVTYSNWSGYAATAAAPFNEAQTTFVQPSVTCTVPGAWTVFWVGFDGFNNNTVEQAGTAAQCGSGSDPQPVYYAWWEMYPSNPIQVMRQVAITPGDTIHAAVAYTASTASYTLNVADLTDKQQYTELASCARNLTCARSSADWIVERPTLFNGTGYTSLTPLADWSTMRLASNDASDSTKSVTTGDRHHRVTTITNVLQPVSAFSNAAINMGGDAEAGVTLARVGKLDRAGSAFSDTWQAAQ